MKTSISLIAVAAAVAMAAPALAQASLSVAPPPPGPSEGTVTLSADAEPYCTLPDSWSYVSGFNGGGGSQFSGTTWTIPASALADTSGNANTGGEFAIRIRGEGSCNTSHSIQLQSVRGGLTTGANTTDPAPAGFSRRRAMEYRAHWVAGDGLNGSNGVMNFAPTSPGQMSGVYNYVVGATKPPPGNRGFDIRLGMQRGTGGAGLLVAGTYSDQLLVTISVAP